MVICKNCGVELEDNMVSCPLCNRPVNPEEESKMSISPVQLAFPGKKMTRPQKKFTWEIVSLVLVCSIAATFVIDFILNKKITWSAYPAATGLIIFSYVSVFAFWPQKTVLQLMAGFILSSAFMISMDLINTGITWSARLVIPVLFSASVFAALLVTVIRESRYKGLNIIAWALVCAAALCISIEAALSWYIQGEFRFTWSAIVLASAIPMVIVLLFIHFRLKKGRSLKKTFHI